MNPSVPRSEKHADDLGNAIAMLAEREGESTDPALLDQLQKARLALTVEQVRAADEAEIDAAPPPAYSDDALASRFSQAYRDLLRYVPNWGWLEWDGARWRRVVDVVVMEHARRSCRAVTVDVRADPALSDPAKEKLARQISSAKTAAAVEKLARGAREHFAEVADFDADPWLFNTPGGTVDLRTGALRPHQRSDRITKVAGATPTAAASGRWLAFLERVQGGDVDRIAYLQRLAGYALAGDASEEILAYLHGGGGNGKGTFLNTLTAAWGDYATTSNAETFMEATGERHPTDLAKLAGARLVVAQEVDEGKRWNEALVKSLTGRDKISARFMRRDHFEFQPVFTLILAGNHKPGLKTVDDAIRRRFHLVPFEVTISEAERDPGLKDALLAELGGVLAWAVAGCLEWQKRRLDAPASIRAATEEYFEDEDTFGLWLADCCIVGSDHSETPTRLHESFRVWKEARGEGAMGARKFGGALVDRGFKRRRTGVARLHEGLRLNELEAARLDRQPRRFTHQDQAEGDA